MTSIEQLAMLHNSREICRLKHSVMRKEFYEELLQENPDCLCEQCDGYDIECSAYEARGKEK